MKLNKALCFLTVGIMVLNGLTGCGPSENTADLENYIARIKHQTVGHIEPLPEVKPYESFSYVADKLRSPFSRPLSEQNAAGLPSNNGLHPDVNRRREVLESFPIDALRMLGTLEKNGKLWAIVKDSDAVVHRVSAGNYMGQNYGHIDNISEDNIKITEIVPDGQGGWMKRKSAMALIIE